MKSVTSWMRTLFLAIVTLFVASGADAVSLAVDAKLPDAVTNTFRGKYPKAVIEKIDVTEENGVNVYDIEFVDGPMDKETDIAEDGTMLEFTHVIAQKEIPAAPRKTILGAAKGAKLGRLEKIEIDYTTEAGKVVKLPATVWRFAAEMTKKGQQAEIIVNADGTVSEEPKWVPITK
jgi:hypothetical protein